MDQLLTSTDDDGAAMSEQALRDELLTLLVAGQETSAVLLSWALAFLAHNPAWQQACAAEVRDQLQGSTPTAENIGYASNCICLAGWESCCSAVDQLRVPGAQGQRCGSPVGCHRTGHEQPCRGLFASKHHE